MSEDYAYKFDHRAPLTDAEIDELEKVSLVPDRSVIMPTMRLRRMLTELRQRRAADLTTAEVEALKWTQTQLRAIQYERARAGSDAFPNPGLALSVLSRLLSDAQTKAVR